MYKCHEELLRCKISRVRSSNFPCIKIQMHIILNIKKTGILDGVDGIATNYGLEGPGIESLWGRDFPHLPRPAPRHTQPPIQWVPGLSHGKGGRGVVLIIHPI